MPADVNDIAIGAYQGTWDDMVIGNVGLGGYKKRYNYSRKDVNFDAVGNVPVDSLFTGLNMFVDFVIMQYHQEAISAMTWPWAAQRGLTPTAGRSMWDFAKPLVLTGCNDTVNPLSITFHKTIIAPDYEVIHNYEGTVERMIPMRLIVFPVKYSNTNYNTPLRPEGCTDVCYFTETLVA